MIYTVTSTQNQYIKMLKSLKNKKGRAFQGLFIAEGDKCAIEAIENGCAAAILTTNEAHGAIALAEKAGADVYIVNEAVMGAVCEAKTPQAVLAVVKTDKLPRLDDFSSGSLFVALEDVSDPQNVGTIIRTADAAGAAGIIVSKNTADCTSQKAVRAAMGSIFHVPVIAAEDFYSTLEELKKEGIKLIAGHLKGHGNLPEMQKSCVMIGNESRGLSERASEIADVLYRINIYGRAESLNAAVAAGILLYKIADR